MKWYGNIDNRLDEGKQFVEEIKVGDGVTEYHYSDRDAYEVVAVKDQKHISIREYDHKHIGEGFQNNWELISNENNRVIDLVKRGNYWYTKNTATIDDLNRYNKADYANDDISFFNWFFYSGFNAETIMKKGSQTKYNRMNISIGVADYYYDYEF